MVAEGFTGSTSGLQYQITQEGTGSVPLKDQEVDVAYTGWLEGHHKGKPFDSSLNRPGTPFTFRAGTGRVIKGWDESVLQMKVGEKRLIILPPDLAYGSSGAGSVIPPNSTLYFEMELRKIL
eukprot:TRINITY_DN181494_c0_g1_i1.p1 TRINITY_DN181494_c0_g1~~TRINITY_DN181494_c0_g1_i1.p1  ORF type:complete len:122 (-),score=4.00 TRINITY_DN181494_c0_g1_i1:360-725(-)